MRLSGVPAAPGVGVALERRGEDGWTVLAEHVTNDDGRIANFIGHTDAGIYRLIFDIQGYAGAECFYPEVVVAFRVGEYDTHCHVPLLLSPFAYSTYRGT